MRALAAADDTRIQVLQLLLSKGRADFKVNYFFFFSFSGIRKDVTDNDECSLPPSTPAAPKTSALAPLQQCQSSSLTHHFSFYYSFSPFILSTICFCRLITIQPTSKG